MSAFIPESRNLLAVYFVAEEDDDGRPYDLVRLLVLGWHVLRELEIEPATLYNIHLDCDDNVEYCEEKDWPLLYVVDFENEIYFAPDGTLISPTEARGRLQVQIERMKESA